MGAIICYKCLYTYEVFIKSFLGQDFSNATWDNEIHKLGHVVPFPLITKNSMGDFSKEIPMCGFMCLGLVGFISGSDKYFMITLYLWV